MPVVLNSHKLAYMSVPKCACSSVKMFFYEIENGRPFEAVMANEAELGIHHFYKSIGFPHIDLEAIDDFTKIAVVRDPVQRLASCYADKVINRKHLQEPKARQILAKHGLTVHPDFPTFVENLVHYQEASALVRSHSLQMRHFLGTDGSYYDHIFDCSQLDELKALVEQITGRTAEMRHANRMSESKKKRAVVDASIRSLIEKKFASDYEIFGNWMISDVDERVPANTYMTNEGAS